LHSRSAAGMQAQMCSALDIFGHTYRRVALAMLAITR
jgi:hypothetical protein